MKYFLIVIMMSFFIITYVWQNIEIMKMKMEYRKLIDVEMDISEENDRIRFNLESLRSFRNMKSFAEQNRLKQIGPDDVININIGKGNKKEKNED
ncbi:MAG: hypothetical protein WDA74_12055 [Spirochaetota bacterium]